MTSSTFAQRVPEKKIDVVEPGRHAIEGHIPLNLTQDVKFSTEALQTYATAREPVIYDAMVVAAAIEYGDMIVRRPSQGWPRQISLQIPVHDPDRWVDSNVSETLRDTIEFLTGDYWSINFRQRSSNAPVSSQRNLKLPVETEAVIAYSDGMDSCAVAGIISASPDNRLVRVRVGSQKWNNLQNANGRQPFTMVPYNIRCEGRKESSARSRGFKFALISALAAYLIDVAKIVMPESGQGIFGPVLVPVGHTYPDYRNHPLFTTRMQKFIEALLEKRLRYVFPRIWSTKGETLREFVSLCDDSSWCTTKSCWRDNRWSSVKGKYRQCGVCAACMLRRVAVHAAGQTEPDNTYVTIDMDAKTLKDAVDPGFQRMTRAFCEYAIAGSLHLNHMAEIPRQNDVLVASHAILLAPVLGLSNEKSRERLSALLSRHAQEWQNYMDSLEQDSFVRQWARGQ